MPIRNQEILRALDEMCPSDTPATKVAQIAALDDLIRVNVNEATHFRVAVIRHQAVLGKEENPGVFVDVADTDDFLTLDGDEAQNNGIVELQQKAAEARVKFGPTDLASLKEIVNPELNLRAWLKTKGNFFGNYDWETEPHLLTDEAIVRTKARAKLRIMLQITATVDAAVQKVEQLNADIMALLEPTLQASGIAGVIEKLTSMREEMESLQQKRVENDAFFEDEEGRLSARVEPIAEEIEETTAFVKEKAITFIDSQRELFRQQDAVDFNTAMSAVIKPRLDEVLTISDGTSRAFVLAELCCVNIDEEIDEEEDAAEELVDEALVNARGQRDEIERGLNILKAQYYNKLASEKAAFVLAKVTEVSQHNGSEVERNRLAGMAEAAYKTIEEQATASASQVGTMTEDALYQGYDAQRASIIALNDATQAALRAAKDNLEFSRILVALPKEPRHFGNLFVDRGRETFDTVVVRKGSALPEAVVTPSNDALAVQVGAVDNQPKYWRVDLKPGDVIYSTVAFAKPPVASAAAVPTGKVTLQLVQDHTGKVTRHIEGGALDAEQSLIAAIRQAELLLNNYQSGDITLTGAERHAPHAQILLAVLLVLQQKCPALAGAKIVSEVRGCSVDKPSAPSRWNFLGTTETQDVVNQRFIDDVGNKLLGQNLADDPKLQRIGDQINKLVQVKTANRQEFDALKQRIQRARREVDGVPLGETTEELARRLQDVAFKENEEIDLEGHRSLITVR